MCIVSWMKKVLMRMSAMWPDVTIVDASCDPSREDISG